MAHVFALGTPRSGVGSNRITPAGGRPVALLLSLAPSAGRAPRAALRQLFFPTVAQRNACAGRLCEPRRLVRRDGALLPSGNYVIERQQAVRVGWSNMSRASLVGMEPHAVG